MRTLILAPFDAAAVERLRGAGDVVYESWIDERRMHSPDDLTRRLVDGGFDTVVVEAEFVTRDVMQGAPGLRVIASTRGKPVNVDVDAATELGRVVLQTPGRNAESVADLCMAMILDRVRHLVAAATLVRSGGWQYSLDGGSPMPYVRFRGVELSGRTLGLIGFGAVGREVARRALAFGMRVQAHDPYVEADVLAAAGVEAAGLDALLETSDIVSVHVELTPQTRHLLDEPRLRRMKPGAVLVNTARALVVDQEALAGLLADGHLGAVALDVFSPEPVPAGHPLLGDDRALLLPHIGGATVDVVRRHSAMITEDLERLARGERPLRCANPVVLESLVPGR